VLRRDLVTLDPIAQLVTDQQLIDHACPDQLVWNLLCSPAASAFGSLAVQQRVLICIGFCRCRFVLATR
jgi:hypothetical protein